MGEPKLQNREKTMLQTILVLEIPRIQRSPLKKQVMKTRTTRRRRREKKKEMKKKKTLTMKCLFPSFCWSDMMKSICWEMVSTT